jgi:hypothetical protein
VRFNTLFEHTSVTSTYSFIEKGEMQRAPWTCPCVLRPIIIFNTPPSDPLLCMDMAVRRPNGATAINFMLLLLSRRSQARNRKNANSPLPSGEFYAHVRRWVIEMREPGQNTGILQQCALLKEALSR